MAILLIPMVFVMRYFFIHNPEFLERRMRTGEKEKTQKKIIRFSFFFFLLAFILPGLDKRWGWSNVPLMVVIIADLLVVISYVWIVRVFKENIYASRIIEVDQEQKVISSGPYAVIRHPMYTGVVIMYSVSPLALGSWWALIPGLMIIPVLVARLLNEEEVLSTRPARLHRIYAKGQISPAAGNLVSNLLLDRENNLINLCAISPNCSF